MDIGEVRHVIEIEPLVVPVPEVLPIPAPSEASVPEDVPAGQRA